MYGLQEHEMRFYSLFKKVYFSLLATSDFFCRHAYAYAHMGRSAQDGENEQYLALFSFFWSFTVAKRFDFLKFRQLF